MSLVPSIHSMNLPRRRLGAGLLTRSQLALSLAVFVIIMLGLVVRMHRLGDTSFWTDELFHVVAAQSLVETGEPTIPHEGRYGRALPVSRITALCIKWIGSSEFALRLPWILVNIAFIAAAFVIIRRLFDPLLAVIVCAVLAFAPIELQIAREVRMYGLLQLLYFVGSFLFLTALEWDSSPTGPALAAPHAQRRSGLVRGAILLAAACGILLFAVTIHPLAINFPIAVGAYCLVMILFVATKQGVRRSLRSRYTVLLLLMAIAVAAVAWIRPELVARLVRTATERAPWDKIDKPFQYYRWFFMYHFPMFTVLCLIGTVLLIRDYGRRGLFVACSFLPLIVMHFTFFTGRVKERYITYILPFFFILACYAIAQMGWRLYKHLDQEWRRKARLTVIATIIALIPVAHLLIAPWLYETISGVQSGWPRAKNWQSVRSTLHQLADEGIILTTKPLETTYYSGRYPDYLLRTAAYGEGYRDHDAQRGDQTIPIRWVTDEATLGRVLDAHDRVYVVSPNSTWSNDAFVDEDMRSLIEQRMKRVPHGGDRKIFIYSKEPS